MNLPNSRFCHPSRQQNKIKRKRKDRYPDFARTEKAMEHEGNGDTNCYKCARNNPKWIGKRSGRFGNKRTSGGHPDYNIIKIVQNTEKSPEDLQSLKLQRKTIS